MKFITTTLGAVALVLAGGIAAQGRPTTSGSRVPGPSIRPAPITRPMPPARPTTPSARVPTPSRTSPPVVTAPTPRPTPASPPARTAPARTAPPQAPSPGTGSRPNVRTENTIKVSNQQQGNQPSQSTLEKSTTTTVTVPRGNTVYQTEVSKSITTGATNEKSLGLTGALKRTSRDGQTSGTASLGLTRVFTPSGNSDSLGGQVGLTRSTRDGIKSIGLTLGGNHTSGHSSETSWWAAVPAKLTSADGTKTIALVPGYAQTLTPEGTAKTYGGTLSLGVQSPDERRALTLTGEMKRTEMPNASSLDLKKLQIEARTALPIKGLSVEAGAAIQELKGSHWQEKGTQFWLQFKHTFDWFGK